MEHHAVSRLVRNVPDPAAVGPDRGLVMPASSCTSRAGRPLAERKAALALTLLAGSREIASSSRLPSGVDCAWCRDSSTSRSPSGVTCSPECCVEREQLWWRAASPRLPGSAEVRATGSRWPLSRRMATDLRRAGHARTQPNRPLAYSTSPWSLDSGRTSVLRGGAERPV